MKIPNYDCQDPITNFKQLHPFMPDRTFRMLICGPSGSGENKCSSGYDFPPALLR